MLKNDPLVMIAPKKGIWNSMWTVSMSSGYFLGKFQVFRFGVVANLSVCCINFGLQFIWMGCKWRFQWKYVLSKCKFLMLHFQRKNDPDIPRKPSSPKREMVASGHKIQFCSPFRIKCSLISLFFSFFFLSFAKMNLLIYFDW